MAKGITKFFPTSFFVMLIFVFFTASITPIGATEKENQNQEQHHKRNKKFFSAQKKDQSRKNRQLELKDQLEAKGQLKKIIDDLSEKKDKLQKTYMYWTLSTACAGYSLYNSSEDVFYRCLHVALNIAPYITSHLPSRAQPYFQGGVNGASFLLEGMRALVHTKQWAWEQILGYSSLCFMKALPEGTLGEEMQGGLYFFFKAAGFYRVNFSLPYLPDSLWEQIQHYGTFSDTVADDALPGGSDEMLTNMGFIMSKSKKKEVYSKLEASFYAADFCQPDVQKKLDEMGLLGSYRGKINDCNSIISSWEKLKPKQFSSHSFSIAPSSEVLIVNQRQYAVANGHDFKHVLVTGDIMKCVGLALYNSETNRCGLAHADGENIRNLDAFLEGKYAPKDNIDDFQRFFLDVAGKTSLSKIRAALVSGYSPHINYFKKYMEIIGIKNIEIIHNVEWGKLGNSYYNDQLPKGSIAIDCGSGKLWKVENELEIKKQMGPPPEDKGALRPLIKVRGRK